eukprot:Gb_09644 [translate_table: standard]
MEDEEDCICGGDKKEDGSIAELNNLFTVAQCHKFKNESSFLVIPIDHSSGGIVSDLYDISTKEQNELVESAAEMLYGFRDHSVYKGHQVFLYKRAQIFVADVWGAFKGQGYGAFHDIGSITIFADYIVPAVLRQLGVLTYSPSLATIVDGNRELASGTEEEVEIRACTIYAVEKMRELIGTKVGKEYVSSSSLGGFQVFDLFLMQARLKSAIFEIADWMLILMHVVSGSERTIRSLAMVLWGTLCPVWQEGLRSWRCSGVRA